MAKAAHKKTRPNLHSARGNYLAQDKNRELISGIVLATVLIAVLRRERHPSKHFSGLRRADDLDLLELITMIVVTRWQSGGLKYIGDLEQFVRVCALIAAVAKG